MSKDKQSLSQEFAQLLYNSLLPQEVKNDLLKEVSKMSTKQLRAFYKILKSEEAQVKLLKMEFDMQIKKIRNQK